MSVIPSHDPGVLGPEVVEGGVRAGREVAVGVALAGERRGAAVVVERRVVEPGRHLDVGLAGRHQRRVGERRLGVDWRERLRPVRVVAVVERGAGAVAVGLGLGADVGQVAVRVVLGAVVRDDVGRVVGDDVEEDLEPAPVGEPHQPLHVGVGAQVRVDPREVGDPVAVVAGRLRARRALHRLVLERRRQPDRGGAEILDVVEPVDHALQVAAVEERLVGRVVARHQAVVAEPGVVVAPVAVLEPVGHHEVEALAGEGGAQAVVGEPAIGVAHGRGRVGGHDGHLVGLVVVAEPQRGVVDEPQDHVAAVRGAVAVVPAAVEADLPLVAAGRDVGHQLPSAGLAGRRHVGGLARLVPVGVAAELAHHRAHHRDPVGIEMVGDRRGGEPGEAGEPGEGEDGGGEAAGQGQTQGSRHRVLRGGVCEPRHTLDPPLSCRR